MAPDQSAAMSPEVQVAVDPPHAVLPPGSETAVTIGCFDGAHLGHRCLVERLAARASETGRLAAAVTFEPHPRRVLNPDQPITTLTTVEERVALLRAAGADLVATVRFTPAVAALPPETFTAFLVRQLRMRELWVGPDFALGRARAGTVPALRSIGVEQGFSLHVIETYRLGGELVKSSVIRLLLGEGAVEQANHLLGRLYAVGGEVVAGAHRGHRLGFPTANVVVPEGRLLPAFGVYAVRVRTAGAADTRPGVANLGVRPTFGEQRVVLEVHILDFAGELYGQRVQVAFVQRLREERRFASLDELRAQIARDVELAREVLSAGAEEREKAARWP